ncbi:hypothetical protein HJC23_008710 [Cyclotella cryptica]|uniref:Uncharacterized protein n=1 Tax=Cyclotella cryptica TaxID=29204 RepID=A0ABD3QGN4_9STRA
MNQHSHPAPFCSSPAAKGTQLTKFAFLLSAALPEGSTTPVIGLNHHIELARCFVPSGIISCSSLSMHGSNSCSNGGDSSAALQERLASLNMNSPIYKSSSPDSVASTPKMLLTNTVRTMEELMESRLSGTVLQLLNTANSSAGHTRVMVHLLSPSRTPIKICTVVTRFESSQEADDKAEPEEGQQQTVARMVFKAVLDVKIFGEVTTVELSAPVVIIGRFDGSAAAAAVAGGAGGSQGPLLTSVDINFDCVALLRDMISNARILVKAAVTEAAALSVKIGSIAGGATPLVGGGKGAENVSGLDGGIAGDAISGSAGMLAVALNLRTQQQQQQQQQQENSSLLTPASLHLGKSPALGSSPLDNTTALGLVSSASTQGHDSTANLASLSSLLNSSSSNHLGSTANLSSHPLSSMLSLASFGSLASLGTIGTKNTFASLLKSSNSLNQLNSEWLLKRPRSNHILRRHLQNVGGAVGPGGSGSNANATFDFGSTTTAGHGTQGHNLFQGLAGGGLNDFSGSSVAKNPRFGNVSNDSIGAGVNVNSVVRFKDPAPSPSTHEVAAAALGGMKSQDQTLKQTLLDKAEDMLPKSPTTAGAVNVYPKQQLDLLREMLLKKSGGATQGAASGQLKSQADFLRELLGTGLAASSVSGQANPSGTSLQAHDGQPQNRAQSLNQAPRQPTPPPTSETKPEPTTTTTNIHKGLFSWLEKDSMFLTEEKIKEQNRIHAKKQQESREAPMPLRFFSSAEEGNLERMGEVLFGGEKRKSGTAQGATKKRKTQKA